MTNDTHRLSLPLGSALLLALACGPTGDGGPGGVIDAELLTIDPDAPVEGAQLVADVLLWGEPGQRLFVERLELSDGTYEEGARVDIALPAEPVELDELGRGALRLDLVLDAAALAHLCDSEEAELRAMLYDGPPGTSRSGRGLLAFVPPRCE